MSAYNERPTICFVSPNNYAILCGRTDIGHIGGAETQQALIARELVARGYRISFVTLDHGQPDGIEHDGIRVFKMCARGDGLPVVRFVHPRWTSLWRAMTRANADIYYQRNGGAETGQVALWCRSHRRRFVFAVAGDPQCERSLWRLPTRRERVLYRYGLRHADCVVTQTQQQRRLLLDEFKVDSVVVRSCAPDSGLTPRNGSTVLKHPRLVWLGRITEQKGLHHLLDFAEAYPEITIDLVGDANVDSAYARRIKERASSLPNVVLHGRVPYTQVDEYYRRASALLLTSDWEGFPNTFLEAWSRGLPVVTRWDADGTVATNQLGVVDSDTGLLVAKVRKLLASAAEWDASSRRARSFFLENHTAHHAAEAYDKIFRRWCKADVPGGDEGESTS